MRETRIRRTHVLNSRIEEAAPGRGRFRSAFGAQGCHAGDNFSLDKDCVTRA